MALSRKRGGDGVHLDNAYGADRLLEMDLRTQGSKPLFQQQTLFNCLRNPDRLFRTLQSVRTLLSIAAHNVSNHAVEQNQFQSQALAQRRRHRRGGGNRRVASASRARKILVTNSRHE